MGDRLRDFATELGKGRSQSRNPARIRRLGGSNPRSPQKTIAILVGKSKGAKKAEENDWKKWVKTVENPGVVRQDGYSPVPDIEEIKLGTSREINTADVTRRVDD